MSPEEFIEKQAVPFINSLIAEMTNAFVCHPVLKAFKALNPKDLPDKLDDLADQGMVKANTYCIRPNRRPGPYVNLFSTTSAKRSSSGR